jgi:micrococcal nuclease
MRIPSRLPSIGSLAILAILVVVLISGRDGGDSGGAPSEADPAQAGGRGLEARVARVVDGDTIEVEIGGGEDTVRYIGVDTPESVKPDTPVQCYALAASHFNEGLVEGRTVRLVFDAERRDVYGRLLAYVYLGDRFVNADLVRLGYATTLTIAPNDRFAGLFDRLEQAASAAGRGLWGACDRA